MSACVLLAIAMLMMPVSASAKVVKIMKINVEGARMRTGSGLIIQKPSLKKGEKVFYAGKKYKSFCYVCTTSGRKGYVYDKFLSSYGAVNSSQVYRTKGKTALYKKVGSGKKGTIGKGKYVMVYEVRGNWAYVKTTSGTGGYVRTSSLTK